MGLVLEQTGSTTMKRGGSGKTDLTPKIIAAVQEAMIRSRRGSTNQHAFDVGINVTSVRKVFHKDLNLYPYNFKSCNVLIWVTINK